jgi:hypothetical protein
LVRDDKRQAVFAGLRPNLLEAAGLVHETLKFIDDEHMAGSLLGWQHSLPKCGGHDLVNEKRSQEHRHRFPLHAGRQVDAEDLAPSDELIGVEHTPASGQDRSQHRMEHDRRELVEHGRPAYLGNPRKLIRPERYQIGIVELREMPNARGSVGEEVVDIAKAPAKGYDSAECHPKLLGEKRPPRRTVELLKYPEKFLREECCFDIIHGTQDIERGGMGPVEQIEEENVSFALRRHAPDEVPGEISPRIEDRHSLTLRNQLTRQIQEECGFAAARTAGDGGMPGELLRRQDDRARVRTVSHEEAVYANPRETYRRAETKGAPMAIALALAAVDKDRRTAARAVKRLQSMTVAAKKGQDVAFAVIDVVVATLPTRREREDVIAPRTARFWKEGRKHDVAKEGTATESPEAPHNYSWKRIGKNKSTWDCERESAPPQEPSRKGDAVAKGALDKR